MPRGLHRARDLQRDLGVVQFALIAGDPALEDQAAEVAVGGDVVEPVVVHADVGDVRRHVAEGLRAAELQHRLVAGGVEVKECHPELEALRPLRPAPRGVAPLPGEDGRAPRRIPGGVDRADLGPCELEHAGGLLLQLLRRQAGFDLHGLEMAERERAGGPVVKQGRKGPRRPVRFLTLQSRRRGTTFSAWSRASESSASTMFSPPRSGRCTASSR